MDFFDVEPHVRLPLPTAQHQVIHFLGACARSLQDSALSNALNHLQEITKKGSAQLSQLREGHPWKSSLLTTTAASLVAVIQPTLRRAAFLGTLMSSRMRSGKNTVKQVIKRQ